MILHPINGKIERGVHPRSRYRSTSIESLDIEESALTSIQKHYPQLTGQEARDYLGGWGFDGGMVARPINSLSGGEKARFAGVVGSRKACDAGPRRTDQLPPFDMRDALVLALKATHRRGADSRPRQGSLEKLVDEFWLVDDGGLTDYTADLNEYTGIKQAHDSQTEDDSQTADDSKRSQRRERARIRESLNGLRKELKEVEKSLSEKAQQSSP